MTHIKLRAVCVGLPQAHGTPGATDPQQREWISGFFKRPVEGPLWLGRTNLVGDGQADLRFHGGPDKAALAYAAEHYPLWREELGIADLSFGGFGENFTIEGLSETSVCLGDVFSMGEARVQVSQPRQPCWKMGRRWSLPELPKLAIAKGRMGWYLRVLDEGHVTAGQLVELIDRPLPQWPIARLNHLMYEDKRNADALAEMVACPFLSEAWRDMFEQRLAALRME
jgi:MOSC domain-containing protein YiiM